MLQKTNFHSSILFVLFAMLFVSACGGGKPGVSGRLPTKTPKAPADLPPEKPEEIVLPTSIISQRTPQVDDEDEATFSLAYEEATECNDKWLFASVKVENTGELPFYWATVSLKYSWEDEDYEYGGATIHEDFDLVDPFFKNIKRCLIQMGIGGRGFSPLKVGETAYISHVVRLPRDVWNYSYSDAGWDIFYQLEFCLYLYPNEYDTLSNAEYECVDITNLLPQLKRMTREINVATTPIFISTNTPVPPNDEGPGLDIASTPNMIILDGGDNH